MSEIKKSTCANCGASLHSKYCHECGQKQITAKDKRLLNFFEELINNLFFANGKFLKTFRLLVFKPGELSKSYISGIRKRYLSPLQLFFFGNLIYFLFPVLSTFNTSLYTQLNRLPYSASIRPVVERHLETNAITFDDFAEHFERVSENNGKLLLILLVFLQAALLALLFVKREPFYFIDFIAVSAYFNSFYIIVLLIVFPSIVLGLDRFFDLNVLSLLNEVVLGVTISIAIFSYLSILLKRTFGIRTLHAMLRAVCLTAFLIPSFIIYRYVLFWATFWIVS